MKTPSIIVRNETEWPEILNERASIITSVNKIVTNFEIMKDRKLTFDNALFGDGKAVKIISNFINQLRD